MQTILAHEKYEIPQLRAGPELKGRVEDARLLTGKGKFVDDKKMENQAYMGLVRSPYAHARIKSINFSKAKAASYFIASLTGDDLLRADIRPLTQVIAPKPANRYHLAVGKVRYAGEAVAAVLVKTRYSVEDALDDVEVEYEELPSITTIEQSKRGDILLYEEWKDNLHQSQEVKNGDVEQALATASQKVKTKIGIKRQAGTPIEPRGVVVSYNEKDDVYEVHVSTQGAQRIQQYLSSEMQIPKEKFHVTVMDVGGGFGTKGVQSYPEDVLACLFAKRTGYAVKWISTRSEDLTESASGRGVVCDIELACDEQHRITGLRANIEQDAGISGSLSTPNLITKLLPGAYKIPNIAISAKSYVTNKAPLGPVRGAGRPEATFFIERAMDMMAKKLNIDPMELRHINALKPRDFPYDNGVGFVYDSGNLPLMLDRLENLSDYRGLKMWKDRIHQTFLSSESKSVAGIGISLEIDDTGGSLFESGKVSIDKNGNVTIYTGSSPHGQGLETTLAQLASEELGVPMGRMRVVWGDTALIPIGLGTYGSKSIATGGSSIVDASRKLKVAILTKASEILPTENANELTIRNGSVARISRLNEPVPLLTLTEVMEKLGLDEISANSDYKLSSATFASGAHLCAITMDVETGMINIRMYMAVDDCGRVVNETIVEGQLHGGIVHGIGGALLEELSYDSDGHLLASNFLDYNIPTSLDSPSIRTSHIETPSRITLHGAKGVGESGTIGAYSAVMNAVNDALASLRSDTENLNIAPAILERVYFVIKSDRTLS